MAYAKAAQSSAQPKIKSGRPVLARFWLGRGKFQDRILCRPRGTRSRINRPPTVETVGYHLSRPRRSGCAGLVPQPESRVARRNELNPSPAKIYSNAPIRYRVQPGIAKGPVPPCGTKD